MNDGDKIAFLRLQRAALVDTQTLFQILIDKGICTIEDIVDTRSKIESENPSVLEVDAEIARLTGIDVDSSSVNLNREELLKQVSDLRKFLEDKLKKT